MFLDNFTLNLHYLTLSDSMLFTQNDGQGGDVVIGGKGMFRSNSTSNLHYRAL